MPENTAVEAEAVQDPVVEAATALVQAAFACLSPFGPSVNEEAWASLVQRIAEGDDHPGDVALAAVTVLGNRVGTFTPAEEAGDA